MTTSTGYRCSTFSDDLSSGYLVKQRLPLSQVLPPLLHLYARDLWEFP